MNLILKVIDFSMLCNSVVKETGFLLLLFFFLKRRSSSGMAAFLRLCFCGQDIFLTQDKSSQEVRGRYKLH